jgi:polysaccharide pyruvyl transferase WcaK-like protein
MKLSKKIGIGIKRAKQAVQRYYVSVLSKKHKAKKTKRKSSILLMPPCISTGSLGDEAMMVGSCEWLQDKGFKVGMLITNNSEEPSYSSFFDSVVRLEGAYMKGVASSRRFLEVVQSWDALGVFGADVIDGTYGEEDALGMLMRIFEAQCAGMPSRLLGSSVKNRDISPVIKDIVQSINENRLTFRDKESRDRFADVTGLKCDVVADAAFLLEPRLCKESAQIVSKITEEKSKGNNVWGINVNYAQFEENIERKELVKLVTKTAKEIEKEFGRSTLVIIPHDRRGGEEKSDFSIAKDVKKELNKCGVRNELINQKVKSYGVKKVCKNLDFVLSMRMHLAIAAMGASCPVASIAYQGKFKGLYDHFGIEDYFLDGKNISKNKRILDFAKRCFKNRKKVKNKIEKNIHKVKNKSIKNFSYVLN